MSPEEFEKNIVTKAKEIESYALSRFPSMAGNISLRFIDGNFRAGGFQGSTFTKWKKSKGTTLVKTGALRAATSYTTQPGQVTIKNSMPYAKIHNEGFNGTITVKAHSRNVYGKTRIGTGKFNKNGTERQRSLTVKTGQREVRVHSRKMNIPQRQFMPIHQNDSPILNNAIQRQVARDLQTIFKL
jgi:phage gpG-like protein